MTNLVAPKNEQIIQNGITFDIEYKLSQSYEREGAPYDEITVFIYDDTHMIVTVATTKSVKNAKKFVKEKCKFGLVRSPASHAILARRAQQSLI